MRFGHLEITAETCRVPQDDPTADAYAFLRSATSARQTPRFSGWMFASSPALSALDHPRYDVWVRELQQRLTDCASRAGQRAGSAPGRGRPPRSSARW